MGIKMKARATPYSIVGGGVTITDAASGHPLFMLNVIGTTQGITKQENDEISRRIVELINLHGLEVTGRENQVRTDRDM